ncbi:hypothetical protein ANO11243_054570 [Dothideomycetidae sp. 11243]|nr:hypothetical protein ANO11243_054570 [fungal sp. No.11243]
MAEGVGGGAPLGAGAARAEEEQGASCKLQDARRKTRVGGRSLAAEACDWHDSTCGFGSATAEKNPPPPPPPSQSTTEPQSKAAPTLSALGRFLHAVDLI